MKMKNDLLNKIIKIKNQPMSKNFEMVNNYFNRVIIPHFKRYSKEIYDFFASIEKIFVDFSIKLLIKDRTSHFFSFIIFTFIVFILSAVLFISDSIKFDLMQTLDSQDQIVVENRKEGKHTQITDAHIDEILQIKGVSDVIGRLDGYYYFPQNESYFHIVEDDNLSDDMIIIGEGVRKVLDKFGYQDKLYFLTEKEAVKVTIQKVLSESTNIISNDIIFANSDTIRRIFSLEDDEYSYLSVVVPNDSETDFIALKINDLFPVVKVTTKSQMYSYYKQLFYYKGGIFMVLYIVAMVSFFILLKHQVSQASGEKKREIAILRSIGFSISDIIKLKFIQNSVIAVSAYLSGVIMAYIYVFVLSAPLLKNIFIGSSEIDISFTPIVSFNILFLIFIFTVIPYLAAILLPSWKVAISDMSEAMK